MYTMEELNKMTAREVVNVIINELKWNNISERMIRNLATGKEVLNILTKEYEAEYEEPYEPMLCHWGGYRFNNPNY